MHQSIYPFHYWKSGYPVQKKVSKHKRFHQRQKQIVGGHLHMSRIIDPLRATLEKKSDDGEDLSALTCQDVHCLDSHWCDFVVLVEWRVSHGAEYFRLDTERYITINDLQRGLSTCCYHTPHYKASATSTELSMLHSTNVLVTPQR